MEDLVVTGITESFDQFEANDFGAFEETALSETDALELEIQPEGNNE